MEFTRLNLRTIKLHFKLSPAYLPVTVFQILFTSLSPYLTLYFSGAIIDEMTGEGRRERLVFLAVMIVGLHFVFSVLESFMSKLCKESTETFYTNYDRMIFNKTMSLDYEMLESPDMNLHRERLFSYEMVAGSVGGVRYFMSGFSSFVTSVISGIISIGFLSELFSAAAEASPGFGMIVLYAAMIIIIALTVWIQLYGTKKEADISEKGVDLWSKVLLIHNSFNPFRLGKDSRIYNLWKFFERSFDGRRDTRVNHEKESASLEFRTNGVVNLLRYTLKLLLYICVCTYMANGVIGIGGVVKYIGIAELMAACFTNIIISGGKLAVNIPFMRDCYTYFDLPVKTRDVEGKKSVPVNSGYDIEFVNVSFKYPGSDNYALRNVSAKINTRTKTAVVGENGCGKTTLVKLMCGLYEPTEGIITLNGVDIRDYRYDEYKDVFSVVFQDFNLFAFTLGENIACDSEYDEEKIFKCIEKAGFSKRFAEMPYGLNTHLYKDFDSEGVIISGGEAQKIALARALYKDAPYIILDEPTSALDPLAEYEIYSRFNEIVGDRTAIYISHRLSSCRFCDDILVLDKGELIQRGSHDTLIDDTSGKYHALWNAQADYYQANSSQPHGNQF